MIRPIPVFGGLLLLVAAGCASPPKFTHDTILLSEPVVLPCHMAERNDLIEISDGSLSFDLANVPERVGIPLVQYNPFDEKSNGYSQTALCPVRSVILRILEDGAAGVFFGNPDEDYSSVRLIPRRIGLSKEGASVRCSISCSVDIEGEKVGVLQAERVEPWTNPSEVPRAVHSVAAAIGDQLFDAIARSGKIKEKINEKRRAGSSPSATRWRFSEISDNGFTGCVDVRLGTWDMARVQRWTRAQIEQTARSKLGVKTLENIRILVDGGSDDEGNDSVSFPFRVFPYRGFELNYDSRTRRGTCIADIAYLGVSEKDAYKRAVGFVEIVLSDQGVVKTAGKRTQPARYRFNGYRTSENGTSITIPFELID